MFILPNRRQSWIRCARWHPYAPSFSNHRSIPTETAFDDDRRPLSAGPSRSRLRSAPPQLQARWRLKRQAGRKPADSLFRFAASSAVAAAIALFCSFSSNRSLPAKPIKKACRISNNPQAFFRDGKVSQALTIVASSALRRAASLSPKLRGFLKAAVGLQDLTLSPRLFQNKQYASRMPNQKNQT